MTTIAERIRNRRQELGMSQDELARLLGYKSRSSIYKIEASGQDLPRKKIEKIAEALHTTPEYIMGWEEKPKEEQPTANRIRIKKRDGTVIEFDSTKLIEAINKALGNLNEPAQNKVLNYIEDLQENRKNLRNFIEHMQKHKKR